MPWTIDARVPVRLGAVSDAVADDALLIEGGIAAVGWPLARFDSAASGHVVDCTCCGPRSPAAAALNQLFQARAKGDVPFFRRVLAVTSTPEGDVAVWSAIRTDPLVSGRFRLQED